MEIVAEMTNIVAISNDLSFTILLSPVLYKHSYFLEVVEKLTENNHDLLFHHHRRIE